MEYRDRPKSWRLKGWFQPQPSSGYDTGKLICWLCNLSWRPCLFNSTLWFLDYMAVFFPTYSIVKLRFREFPSPSEAEAGLHPRSSFYHHFIPLGLTSHVCEMGPGSPIFGWVSVGLPRGEHAEARLMGKQSRDPPVPGMLSLPPRQPKVPLTLLPGSRGRPRSCWEPRLALRRCRKCVSRAKSPGYMPGGRTPSRSAPSARPGPEPAVPEL